MPSNIIKINIELTIWIFGFGLRVVTTTYGQSQLLPVLINFIFFTNKKIQINNSQQLMDNVRKIKTKCQSEKCMASTFKGAKCNVPILIYL